MTEWAIGITFASIVLVMLGDAHAEIAVAICLGAWIGAALVHYL